MRSTTVSPDPRIVSNEIERQFFELQKKLPGQFEHDFPDPLAPKTVVMVPSLTLDPEILSKITGHTYYEERLLCVLLLLRMPRTHVVYVSSMPIDEVIVDYYLHLLSGVTGMHARQRLTLLTCFDPSNRPLTQKILERPRLMQRIRECILPGHSAHLAAFNITQAEQELAVRLGIPLYGCPAYLNYWGTKSGSRELFQRAGLLTPPGYEHLENMQEVAKALHELKREFTNLRKAVVKLNDGFSGDGNAIFTYRGDGKIGEDDVRAQSLFVASDMSYDLFAEKMSLMGGIVEAFIEGEHKTSPSAQCRIDPLQKAEVVSTHDQVLGGESGQVYLGARFPADPVYSRDIGALGQQVADMMVPLGVLGRFGIDFVSVKEKDAWKHYAIEINLRKGGTTHPFLMLQYLTNGLYNAQTGLYEMPNGQSRCYVATDGLMNEKYKALTPCDLIDVAICNDIHFDPLTQEGVTFHLIGALSPHGKLGLLCVGATPKRAEELYHTTVAALDKAVE